jgi:hypothetical protein
MGVYGCTAMLGAVAAFMLPIETKGRAMHDTH